MLGNETYLVTGAGGFIGSHIVDRLRTISNESPNGQVHALGRSFGKLSELNAPGDFTFHQCDLQDNATLYPLLASIKPHVIIHLASEPDAAESGEHSRNCIANNLVSTVNLLDAFASSGNPQGMVYGDSTKVYGSAPSPYRSDVRPEPNSSYSITKAASWEFVRLQARLSGFSAVAIRPTLIYGPRQPDNIISVILDAIRENQSSFTIQGGSQTRAPLHIDDAVDAYIRTVENIAALNSKIINIGGAEEFRVADIARHVVRNAGSDMRILCESTMRDTEILQSSVDLSEAEDLLGWKPSISLAQGLIPFRESILENTV